MKKIVLITVIIALAFALSLTGCDNGNGKTDQPKPQGGTGTEITNLFGKGINVTVKGNFTDAEWGSGSTGVVGRIESVINRLYDHYLDQEDYTTTTSFEEIFGRDVTVIVEKTPIEYTKWKTITDGKTLWLSYEETKDTNLYKTLDAAIIRLRTSSAGFAKASAKDNVPEQG